MTAYPFRRPRIGLLGSYQSAALVVANAVAQSNYYQRVGLSTLASLYPICHRRPRLTYRLLLGNVTMLEHDIVVLAAVIEALEGRIPSYSCTSE